MFGYTCLLDEMELLPSSPYSRLPAKEILARSRLRTLSPTKSRRVDNCVGVPARAISNDTHSHRKSHLAWTAQAQV